jgi:hypothetical protein
MTNKPRVFISYSRDDRPFVDRLSADLRRFGVQTWVDVENIKPGARWDEALNSGLQEAAALVFILSRKMVASRWMLLELQHFASSQNKTIFPVIIQDIDLTQVPSEIRNIQWAEFRYSYDHGLKSLLAAMGIDPSVPTKVAPTIKRVSKGYVFISYTQDDDEFVKISVVSLKRMDTPTGITMTASGIMEPRSCLNLRVGLRKRPQLSA